MTTVKHTLDTKNPPRMNKDERARFDAISDDDIDYSDSPELDAAFWATAKVETPSQKSSVTMRLDAETLEYFKRDDPKGHTTRMAAVLKAFVQAHQPK